VIEAVGLCLATFEEWLKIPTTVKSRQVEYCLYPLDMYLCTIFILYYYLCILRYTEKHLWFFIACIDTIIFWKWLQQGHYLHWSLRHLYVIYIAFNKVINLYCLFSNKEKIKFRYLLTYLLTNWFWFFFLHQWPIWTSYYNWLD